MISKLIFLAKNNSSTIIYLNYLFYKITSMFYKSKIKYFKKLNKKILKNKKISNDYFSMNAYNFYKSIFDLKITFNYLEIGSYEGNSAMFVARNFPKARVNCVDNWHSTEDYHGQDFNIVEENFDYNVSNFKNIKKYKNNSDEFFEKNLQKFDVIYVDGYHKNNQVYKDCKNSWRFLNNKGVLICDDYFWNFYEKIENNPCFGINKFLNEIKNNFKVLKVSNTQIFIKKII